MPLTFHVYDGKKTRDSQTAPEGQRYANKPDATGEVGTGNFTQAQKQALANYKKSSMLRYMVEDAYFCSACWYVFGVECPNCHIKSEKAHNRPITGIDDPAFEVDPMQYDRKDGAIWIVATCRKCSYSFRVIKR